MSIEKQVLKEVLAEQEAALLEKETRLAERKQVLFGELPRLFEIEQAMKQSVSAAARLAFSADENVETAIVKLREANQARAREKKAVLRSHGYDENALQLVYDCPVCNDTGYVGATLCVCVQKACRERQSRKLSQVLNIKEQNFAHFQLHYYNSTLVQGTGISPRENMAAILESAKDYSESFSTTSPNLLFFGVSGVGKTFLSSCIAKQVVEQGFSVVYDSCISVLSTFEREKFKDSVGESDKYFLCDLLILDDLGTEMTTSFTTSTLYHLINSRIISEKPMLINTNLQPKDFASRYTPAIASRLQGDFKCIGFLGEDIRRLKTRG